MNQHIKTSNRDDSKVVCSQKDQLQIGEFHYRGKIRKRKDQLLSELNDVKHLAI